MEYMLHFIYLYTHYCYNREHKWAAGYVQI